MDTLEEVLQHYGILGMKWGVRRDRATLQRLRKKKFTKDTKPKPKSQDAAKAAAAKKKAKKSGVQSLSNQELQTLINRMNLETQYFNVNAKSTSPGKKFAKELIINVGKQQATKLANDQVAKMIGLKLKKA